MAHRLVDFSTKLEFIYLGWDWLPLQFTFRSVMVEAARGCDSQIKTCLSLFLDYSLLYKNFKKGATKKLNNIVVRLSKNLNYFDTILKLNEIDTLGFSVKFLVTQCLR
jgi:hypothetical protein